MNKWLVIGIVAVLFLVVGLVIGSVLYSQNINQLKKIPYGDDRLVGKLRICPDAWVENKMPCPCVTDNCSECDNPPRQYFIIDEKRRELNEFDVNWVNQTCNITKKIVY
ncbi:MAG: hypothetical protein AABX48_02875 [Nanoarchaeota archaeon]